MKKLLALLLVICTLFAVLYASADEEIYFIICKPKTCVSLRRSPKRGAERIVMLDFGVPVTVDGKTKNGYMHVVGITEYGEGWVHKGYLVKDKPVEEKCYGYVTARGRVAARRYIGGKRNVWVEPEENVKVYAYSEEWAVTSKGYIRMEYLELWKD